MRTIALEFKWSNERSLQNVKSQLPAVDMSDFNADGGLKHFPSTLVSTGCSCIVSTPTKTIAITSTTTTTTTRVLKTKFLATTTNIQEPDILTTITASVTLRRYFRRCSADEAIVRTWAMKTIFYSK